MGEFSPSMSRRTALTWIIPGVAELRVLKALANGYAIPPDAAAATAIHGAVLLASCGIPPPSEPQTPIRLATPTPELPPDISAMMDLIRASDAVRSSQDTNMINSTIPGIDLTYYGNKRIQEIRAIKDPTTKVMAAIGYLNVEKLDRYDQAKLFERYKESYYTCNIYALDLLRVLLNDEIRMINPIGSRYNKNTGVPVPVGPAQYQTMSTKELNDAAFLNAYNLDKWMRTEGKKNEYGWQEVFNQDELKDKLRHGYVALGVTSQAYNDKMNVGKKPTDPPYIGHTYIVVDGKTGFIVTQSTANRIARPVGYYSRDPQVNPYPEGINPPPFALWVHNSR